MTDGQRNQIRSALVAFLVAVRKLLFAMSTVAIPDFLVLLTTAGMRDYALLDSGHGRKLERFGGYVFDRPEPQAMWKQRLVPGTWLRDATFKDGGDGDGDAGRWRHAKPLPQSWPIEVLGVTVNCRLTGFRHLGLFPEQVPHWRWMLDHLASVGASSHASQSLRLHGGGVAARRAAGAEVTHVDASKKADPVGQGKPGSVETPAAKMRWLVDDAAKFAARDVRRGKTYHMIIVDPPKFGRGPEGEIWDLFQNLPRSERSSRCWRPRSRDGLTIYAIRASSLAFDRLDAGRTEAAARRRIRHGEFASAPRRGTAGADVALRRWKRDA